MAQDFSTVVKLPDDFVRFDFTLLEEDDFDEIDRNNPSLGELVGSNLAYDLSAFDEVVAKRLQNILECVPFVIDSNLEGVKDAIETAAMAKLRENFSEEDLDGITVMAENHWIKPMTLTYSLNGCAFAELDGNCRVNDAYMDDDVYPIIPYAGEPGGVSASFIGENYGCMEYTVEDFGDFLKVEEGLAENREFAANIDSLHASGIAIEQ